MRHNWNHVTGHLLVGVGALAVALWFGTLAQADIIIDDDVDGNGDSATLVGTTTTAWAGWGGTLPGFGFVPSDLLPLADDVDAGFPDGPLTRLPDSAPVPFANGGGGPISVTYGGMTQEGTYSVLMQMADYTNGGFPPFSANGDDFLLAGLTPSSANLTTPASGDDEIWSLTYEVAAADVGNPLSFSIPSVPGAAGNNFAIDHVQIDFAPVAVPEPTSMVLWSLVGVAAIGYLRLRKRNSASRSRRQK